MPVPALSYRAKQHPDEAEGHWVAISIGLNWRNKPKPPKRSTPSASERLRLLQVEIERLGKLNEVSAGHIILKGNSDARTTSRNLASFHLGISLRPVGCNCFLWCRDKHWPLGEQMRNRIQKPLLILSALLTVPIGALAAPIEYYVVRDTLTKKCTVTDKIPMSASPHTVAVDTRLSFQTRVC